MAKNQTHIVYRDLTCKLTDAEKAGLSVEMAKAELSIETIKGKVQELNTEKRALEGHRNGLAHDVDEGTQEKSVECHWEENLAKGFKRLIRQDTKKMVEETTLTADELQEPIPGTGGKGNVTPIDKGQQGKPRS